MTVVADARYPPVPTRPSSTPETDSAFSLHRSHSRSDVLPPKLASSTRPVPAPSTIATPSTAAPTTAAPTTAAPTTAAPTTATPTTTAPTAPSVSHSPVTPLTALGATKNGSTTSPMSKQNPPDSNTPSCSTSTTLAANTEALSPPPFCAEDDEHLTPLQHMAAGALAGMTEHMAMYPIDTVKTRMQSYIALRDVANLSMFHTTRSIINTEGLAALWRGVSAVAISAGPAHALYFATYEAVRSALTPVRRRDDLVSTVHPVATAVAGACATVVGDGVMTPLDVVKQRMQLSSRGGYSSVWQCTRHVYTHHGIRAFFAGYKATLLMNVPFTAVYFTGYEMAKRFILDWRRIDESQFSVSSHCLAGAIAGTAASATTTPLDVVKTRLQTQGEIGARRYRGLGDALRRIWFEEGTAGLMRGVRPRVLFHMPAAAVCWTTYEFCKHVMGRNGSDKTEFDVSGSR